MNRDVDTYRTEAEIARLTGRKKATAQRAALRSLGYPFINDGDGRPVMLRESVQRLEKRRFGLLAEEEIVRRAESTSKIMGVYFLVHGGRVQYVGKSMHIMERIACHTRKGDIGFDAFYCIRAPKNRMASIERQYIAALRPPANVQGAR